MNSYDLQLKSLDCGNHATGFQTIDAWDDDDAVSIAFNAAEQWGRSNHTTTVQYTVSRGYWWSVSRSLSIAPTIPQPKPSPLTSVTIQINTKDKFFAVLEAFQQYVDNCDDAVLNTGDQDEQSELAAKSSTVAEFRDQLDAVLASLAD
jgi:hypothetical protein